MKTKINIGVIIFTIGITLYLIYDIYNINPKKEWTELLTFLFRMIISLPFLILLIFIVNSIVSIFGKNIEAKLIKKSIPYAIIVYTIMTCFGCVRGMILLN
ncbi:MAG: hypothetical protein H6587_11740 [Flavobacteriales bacterium]|nr:hypothetical protein [Flavobacteriales bacterium]MCB9365234.1 hypothetical protein [Flavobacteriales bacterium]